MILLDLGNSCAKFAARDRLAEIGRLDNDDLDAPTLIGELQAIGGAGEVVIASVRSAAVDRELMEALKSAGYTVRKLDWRDCRSLQTNYDSRKSMGLDRQLALVAAKSVCDEACIVVDMGTATTIDALDASGAHLGGMILPGVSLMRKALLNHTDDIRVAEEESAPSLFPNSTSDAVASGCELVWQQGVIAILDLMRGQLSHESQILLTGGQRPLLDLPDGALVKTLPELVFLGMAMVAEGDA